MILTLFGATAWMLLRQVCRLLLEFLVLVLIWPFALALGLLVLGIDLLATPFILLLRQRSRPGSAASDAPVGPRHSASIIIVSWNGRDFLTRLMPSLWPEVDADGGDHEVIVVDNGSTDDTIEWLQKNYPRTRVVALPENRFFVRGNMAGVATATRDTLVFLNNDMIVKPGFLAPLLAGFTSNDIFAVAAEVFFRDPNKRREETGKTTGHFQGGFMQCAHVMPTAAHMDVYTPTFWAGGGSAAFDRRKFLAMGGWDLTFDPFYLEDTGLSYQAWRRGYRVLFTPKSGVFHEHRGTSRKVFGDDYIDSVIRRNQHLFLWRNVTSAALTAKYFAMLPLGIVERAHSAAHKPFGRALGSEVRALLRALPRLPIVLWRRTASRVWYRRSDEAVVAIANTAPRPPRPCPKPGTRLKVLVLTARLPRLGVDGSWTVFHRLHAQSRIVDLSVFSLIDEASEDQQAEPLREFCARVTTHVRGHEGIPRDTHRQIPERLRRDYSSPSLRAAVLAAIDAAEYDVLQFEYLEMAHVIHQDIVGLPAVWVCHEPHNLFLRRMIGYADGTLDRLVAWYRYVQGLQHEIRYTRPFARIVTFSEVDTKNLQRLVPGVRVHTICSGVELEPMRKLHDIEPEPGAIVFIGYYKHEPNADAAVWLCRDIMPLVHAQEPGAKLYLIGRDPPDEVKALHGKNGVNALGYVDDLKVWLARATVATAPIRQGGGLRGKVLESWAAGRALVSTKVAAEGFVAAVDGEHLLIANDAQSFANAIVRLLRDRALRQRLAAAGVRLVEEHYSNAAVARQYEEMYSDLAGVAPDPSVRREQPAVTR